MKKTIVTILIALLSITAFSACEPTDSGTIAFQSLPAYGENSTDIETVKQVLTGKYGWGEAQASCFIEGFLYYGIDIETVSEQIDYRDAPRTFNDNAMKNYYGPVKNSCYRVTGGWGEWTRNVIEPSAAYQQSK